jgi:hypothetical protein
MKTYFLYSGLVIVLLLSLIQPFGLKFAGWHGAITATDLAFYLTALFFALAIEVRDAANYVVKQLRK